MASVESSVLGTDGASSGTDNQEVTSVSRNGGDRNPSPEQSSQQQQQAGSGAYYNGAAAKRPQAPPPPTKVFFAPQKYGFFTMNNVEQRWRDDPDKDKKTQADDIIANVTEKFFPGMKRPAEPMGPPVAPPFIPPIGPPGLPGLPPPPFMMTPPVPAKTADKRIRFNDEDSDENELFAKLLYKKLGTITSRKRREILHVSIMEMVRQAQEEDERERGVTGGMTSQ